MENTQKSTGYLNRREILKYGIYSGLTAGLASSLWLGGCGRMKPQRMPNILLITVDTLRADHLSCYGYNRNTSPNIDLFARDAMQFNNCLSHAPNTWTSIVSMLSGFLPHETKVIETARLVNGLTTLPEILYKHGYKTIAVVSNYLLRRQMGYDQGFTIYDDKMDEVELNRGNVTERTASLTTDRAIELIKENYKDQLFMWIHYQDPHGPYTAPPQFSEMFVNSDQPPRNLKQNSSMSGYGGIPSYQQLGSNRDFHYYVSQYDGEIRYQDDQFGRLINVCKKYGLYDDSMIIFTSDHGEGMGEHDYYFAHGGNLHSCQTHVPMIIKHGNQLTGKRMDFVQHIDIVPTILNTIGIEPDLPFRGYDLRMPTTVDREIIAAKGISIIRNIFDMSIVFKGFKLIYSISFDEGWKKYQLFDLNTDPHDKHDLIRDPAYQDQAKDLIARLSRISKEDLLGLESVMTPQKLSRDEIEKLKSLGYVQ